MNKVTEYFGNGNQWLRSPSPYVTDFVRIVGLKGDLYETSDFYVNSCNGVVPALHIQLNGN